MKKIIILSIAIVVFQFSCKKVIKNPEIISISSDSTLINNYSGRVNNLIDKGYKAWCEGRKDSGIGVKIQIAFKDKTAIETINIKNGHGLKKYYKGNNRIKSLKLTSGNKSTKIKVQDQFSIQHIAIPSDFDIVTSELELEILEVYKGNKWNDTCITELSFNSKTIQNFIDEPEKCNKSVSIWVKGNCLSEIWMVNFLSKKSPSMNIACGNTHIYKDDKTVDYYNYNCGGGMDGKPPSYVKNIGNWKINGNKIEVQVSKYPMYHNGGCTNGIPNLKQGLSFKKYFLSNKGGGIKVFRPNGDPVIFGSCWCCM